MKSFVPGALCACAVLFCASAAMAQQACPTAKAHAQAAKIVIMLKFEEPKDIVDVAVGAGSFKTLAKALTEAGLIDTLKGKGPFTVFAPTDEAFAKIPEDTLNAVLKDKEKLKAILTYHVVAGKVMAADVVKLDSAKTVQGDNVTITVQGDKVKVNNATVIKTDIPASNGVIHVIDTVIMPPEKK